MDARLVIIRALSDLGYLVHNVAVVPDFGTSYFVVAVEVEGGDSFGGLFDSYSVADPVQLRAWVESIWERVPCRA